MRNQQFGVSFGHARCTFDKCVVNYYEMAAEGQGGREVDGISHCDGTLCGHEKCAGHEHPVSYQLEPLIGNETPRHFLNVRQEACGQFARKSTWDIRKVIDYLAQEVRFERIRCAEAESVTSYRFDQFRCVV